MPCFLCPKNISGISVKNWRRHCCCMHKDFIAHRASLVRYTLYVIYCI
jgi:hypothetical protein